MKQYRPAVLAVLLLSLSAGAESVKFSPSMHASSPLPSARKGFDPLPELRARPSSSAQSSPVHLQLASPRPAIVPFSAKSKRDLTREFLKAQRAELKAIEFRQSFELKELQASQKVRIKEWKLKEGEARGAYFAANPHGAERRAYYKESMQRYNTFLQIMADERTARARDQEIRRNAVRSDQGTRLREFEAYLERGERPPGELWPQPGR